MLNSLMLLLTTITPFATASAEETGEAAAASGGWAAVLPTVLMWGAIIVFGYFLLFRSPRKAAKKKEELRGNIKVGDSVMTNSGIFGKVVEIFADCFIIELGTNKSVLVPIAKAAIEDVREPVMSQQQEK